MTKKIINMLVTLSLLPMVATVQANEPTDTASRQLFEIQNTCIIRFDDGISKFDVEGRARGMVASVNAKAKHIYKHSIKGFAVNMNCDKAKAAFALHPDIVSFESDALVFALPGPPPGRGGGGDSDTVEEQITPWGIDRVGGAADTEADGTPYTAKAWVLDTGIDLDNADLNVDTLNCMSVFTSRKDSSCDDGQGHGTHVAGTIAAINNEIGVVGVAAGATVVPIKVLDRRGSGSISGVIMGVDYVADNAASGDCANLSLGGSKSDSLNEAVGALGAKGVFVSVAAGNESQNTENVSPASAEGENVWTIAAIDNTDKIASFSNYGSHVDYSAPGVGILSLQVGGGTTTKNGTSMAAPHACAVLMLTKGDPNNDGDNVGSWSYPIIHLWQ